MIVGGYSLHLYCDNPGCEHVVTPYGTMAFGEFAGPTERDCLKQARNAGWKFKRTDDGRKCYCKGCKP